MARQQGNRHFDDGQICPPRFAQDWNRSFTLEPAGQPRGAVVLHGLSDTLCGLRHAARQYRAA